MSICASERGFTVQYDDTYDLRPRLQCRHGPSAAFLGVLGTPILCVYSGGLNLVPHLARLAFTVRKSRAERSAKCAAVFGTPFGILSVYSENEPALGPAFFHCKRGLFCICIHVHVYAGFIFLGHCSKKASCFISKHRDTTARKSYMYLVVYTTVYVVIFEVVLFPRILRVGPHENFHFNMQLSMKTSQKSCNWTITNFPT